MKNNKPMGNHLTGPDDSVFYGRFSSDHQRPASIADQADEGCIFVKQRPLLPLGRLAKDEGVSVKDGMAPNFLRLLDDVRAEKVRQIVVDELSRISRKTEDILRVQSICRYHGVELWSVHEGINICDDNADIHVLFAGHKNQAATRDARHRVKRSMDGNIRRGLSNGDLTLGYKSVEVSDEEATQLGLPPRGKDRRPYKRIVVDNDGADIVRLIFQMFVVDKWTIRRIARDLQSKHVPRGGKARSNRWRPINVRKILSNRRYLGFRSRNMTMLVADPDTGRKTSRRQPSSELIEEHDPSLAIIDQETFDVAQQRLNEHKVTYGKRRRKNQGRSTPLLAYAPRQLLAGTLECGECGTKLVQKYNGRVPFYVCPDAQDGLCGNTVQVRRDTVHELVLDAIRKEAAPVFIPDRVHELVMHALQEHGDSSTGELAEAQRRRAKVAAEIENLTKALAQRPESEALYQALDSREADRRRLDAEIRDAERRAKRPIASPSVEWVREQLDRGLEHLVSDNVGRAALLLRAITGPVKVYPGQKPWLRVRYPIIRLNLDFAQMATAAALDQDARPDEAVEGGFGVSLELEVRKVPLYEAWADEVVRLRDEQSLGWTEIAFRLPVKISPEYVALAYRFGRERDLYGHRARAHGRVPARTRRKKAG